MESESERYLTEILVLVRSVLLPRHPHHAVNLAVTESEGSRCERIRDVRIHSRVIAYMVMRFIAMRKGVTS